MRLSFIPRAREWGIRIDVGWGWPRRRVLDHPPGVYPIGRSGPGRVEIDAVEQASTHPP